ncbi:type II secretion system protein N [Marinobacter bohaiensis]|uniref:type II secretion system protein N n=1 Tax=Marinobacter bohaiensis TaxID=2201898 RepID=UPI000DAC3FC4|nr:type II secretion system protein N [Marinobacter bohaiensis]
MTGIYARLPLLIAIVLIVGMLASLGWQGWQFYQARPSSGQATATANPSSESASQGPEQVELSSIDLFGAADPQAASTPQSTENLPETNLRLFLRGVMAGDEDSTASALIEGSDNQTEVYLVGDELPGNATLRSVYADRVIIERSGKLENLYFPETSDRSGIEVAGAAPEAAPEPAASQPPTAQPVQPPRSAPGVTSERREEIRRRLEQLRERLRQNSN